MLGQHTRQCCVVNRVDTEDYDYDGKPKANEQGDDSMLSSSEGSDEENVHPNVDNRSRPPDVSEDMKIYADNLAISSLTLLPAQIWDQTKAKMDEEYPEGWTGIKKASITHRVRHTRMQMIGGDSFRMLENSKYALMTDTTRPFLHHHGIFPDEKKHGAFQRIMVFGNPTNFGLLKTTKVDIYIDATFDCCPAPFYQCLILMVFHQETNVYVPVLYILMTHKTQELYCHALSQVVAISGWVLDVNSYTSDFERAIMNSCKIYFPEGFHIGCLFHLKQAWRRHLIKKLAFLAEEITLAMKIGVLDLLCIIPQDEIREFGIPYVRSIIEKYLSRADIVKWDTFWGTYFEGQWMPILDSWNICTQDGTYKKFLNRTNNGLESYNKRFNGLFPKHNPSLIEFVEIVEKESRYYADKLDDIRKGREEQPTYQEKTIPLVPQEYLDFKN
jgi:hypothetical protein